MNSGNGHVYLHNTDTTYSVLSFIQHVDLCGEIFRSGGHLISLQKPTIEHVSEGHAKQHPNERCCCLLHCCVNSSDPKLKT